MRLIWKNPARENWKEIVPQTENALDSVGIVGNMLVCDYLKDAKTQVRLHAMDGTFVREVEFPGIGTATGFDARRRDTDTFYSFSSFALPPTTYRYNMITGMSELFRRADVKFNPDDYRNVSGVLHQQRRHEGSDVSVPSEGTQAGWHQSDAAVRLRWLQYLDHAQFQCEPIDMDGNGRRAGCGESARRRGVR